MTAPKVLDAYFLEARCKLLDVAAVLDRIDRGEGAPLNDHRVERIRRSIEALLESGPGRAERIQEIFSLEYDPEWKIPQPK
ncbi:hypothetical protein [Zavarzinella formosa]|uniref:hypothetical protein n=1 Tax=Zavarzinella formosa TaxID=360055 RepID=UPI000594DC15|nr:hypothetical protein [Zavarzinella formosa]